MCGIIGCIGVDRPVPRLVDGLENLEYRGYDSAGVAVRSDEGVSIYKRAGAISDVKDEMPVRVPGADDGIGIGHTRWSTHGPPTDANAHPHTDPEDRVAVVHNGVIDNYETLRADLEARGNEFTSDTDTEVIPHLFASYLDESEGPNEAFRRTIEDLEGSFAVAAVVEDRDAIFAAREGTPLVVGIDDGAYYLASDVPAFLNHTDEAIYLDDGDVAVLRPDNFVTMDTDGELVQRDTERIDWDAGEAEKGAYDHYMLKEIHEQPTALRQTIEGRLDPSGDGVTLEDFEDGTFEGYDTVEFVACGTSYHATIYAERLLTGANVDATAHRAGEYEETKSCVDEDTLVVAVTQSGETADTLNAMRAAESAGATTVAVTNVMGSTAARTADEALFIRAGPEIGVAATKTFSSQVVSLLLLSRRINLDLEDSDPRDDFDEVLAALERLPQDVERVLETSQAGSLAGRYIGDNAFFFIGRNLGYPVAKEAALKFKEITYEHAEGFPSGRLKHGPLAMVTSETPVFAVLTDETDEKTVTNAEEAASRGAPIVVVGDDSATNGDLVDDRLTIPSTHPILAGLLANVQLQLVAYHAAERLDRSIDKPRNLAKSVTVE